MNYSQRITDWVNDKKDSYHDRKVSELMRKGQFDAALDHVKRIATPEKQEHILFGNLAAYATSILVHEGGTYRVQFVTDREEYERLRSVAGPLNKAKMILFQDPQTGNIEGLEEVIEAVIPLDNPLLMYLNSLEKSRLAEP